MAYFSGKTEAYEQWSLSILWEGGSLHSPVPLYAETRSPGKRVDSSDHGEILKSLNNSPPVANNHTFLSFELLWDGNWCTFSAFVDSEAAGSFMDSTLAQNLKLPTFDLVHSQSPQWMGNHWVWVGLKGSPARSSFALAITPKRLSYFLLMHFSYPSFWDTHGSRNTTLTSI